MHLKYNMSAVFFSLPYIQNTNVYIQKSLSHQSKCLRYHRPFERRVNQSFLYNLSLENRLDSRVGSVKIVFFMVVCLAFTHKYRQTGLQLILLPFRLVGQDTNSLVIRWWTHRRIPHQLKAQLAASVVAMPVTSSVVFARINSVIDEI